MIWYFSVFCFAVTYDLGLIFTLPSQQKPFDVEAKRFVKVLFGNCHKCGEFPNAGVSEQNIDAALLFLHCGIQPIKICEI
jgi:hypothetical protein